ncbi:C1q-like domain-containing protein [Cystobacter fuscus]
MALFERLLALSSRSPRMRCDGTSFMMAASVTLVSIASVGVAHAEESPRVEVPDYKTVDRVLSRTLSLPCCPGNRIVAFSASGGAHVSEGGATLLGYARTYSNEGGGWTPGGGTFIAPCDGLYSFTVSLVRDPYYYGGTSDDVYSCLTLNGVDKGCAWAGETTASGRSTGTHTVALLLSKGDYVQSFASSDGGYKRHLGAYEFTGFLVKSIDTPNP